ncbi:DcaP family trimeric outer membrane transporter [Marinobacter sp. BGYM27]|uniref:DcaP family trimeric outer membrane transporter n=1 Tax=Marinobacter sp. BGYM27 TaxID=2975597 RepID=UPI0021A3C63B|nr:DcaP family trimeric outer membrane transporter [Marinobacter sp. BGYM27]MDG5500779.1 DcaP family trimeric outer membrane transporter [Marinobacter sp. BGYM27]
MNRTKITIAVQAATSAMIMGLASQAGAFEVTAENVKAEVYGYARMNAVYDIDEDIGASTQSGAFSKVNTGTAENNEVTGVFDADAVQSRIGLRTTVAEDLKMVVEGDFRGNGGGDLRLRHAYGEYKGVLLGQTWSNYNSFVGNTSVLDFDALAGNAGLQGRVTQARYTMGALSFSAEDSNTSILNSGSSKESLPTLTARFESAAGPLSYSAAALVHQISYDTGSQSDDAVGYAVFGAAKFAITPGISIQGALNYSDGANYYLYRSGEDFGAADAYVNGSSLETISGYGGTIGMGFDVGTGSINVGYGIVTNDWDDAEDDLGLAIATQSKDPAGNAILLGDQHETNSNVMVNYQFSPIKNVMMGVEYGYFMVDEVDGDDGDANRILFAGQYNF